MTTPSNIRMNSYIGDGEREILMPFSSSSPSWTLEGLLELTRHPSRALDSPRALLLESGTCKKANRIELVTRPCW